MSLLRALFAVSLCLAPALAQLSCQRALQLHQYALERLGACEDIATQNTALCQLVGNYEATSNSGTDPVQTDQLQLLGNPDSQIGSWQNYLLQSAMTQFADLGEVSFVISQINNTYGQLDTGNDTDETYFAAWQGPWFDQAELNQDAANDANLDALSSAQTFFKAANYYFTGFWPNPFSESSLQAATESVDAFISGLEVHPLWGYFNFSVPFSNGTAQTSLPAYLILPFASDEPLPLFVITGGTDFPKEMNVLQFGIAALDRGFGLLVYDGPGQGQVIRNPPYMPFYPEWDRVFLAVLDYVRDNYAKYVDLDAVVHEGVSLGGYLAPRACSKTGSRQVVCIPNPPVVNVSSTYDRFSEGLADAIYGPFGYVAQQNPSLLPNGYGPDFQNGVGIINTLLLTCDAASGAPQLVAEAFASNNGPIDPELIYLAGGYGGVVSGDPTVLYGALWSGFRQTQTFGDYDIGNITVPVIGFKGTQDDLLGGQEDAFFARLNPELLDDSTLIELDGSTGGALHCQVGSPYLLAAKTFGALLALINKSSS